MLFEDETVNRMEEALQLFEEVVNSNWFQEANVVLFLNKRDLFEEKIQRVPLTACFSEYDGPGNYDSCVQYIQQKFLDSNRTVRLFSISIIIICVCVL